MHKPSPWIPFTMPLSASGWGVSDALGPDSHQAVLA
jgi:hypothetical protein